MNRYFRWSLDQKYEVQSRPRIPQTSRRQENYRVGQPRLQTSFDVLPYDHSPKGSPETRHSRTDTGNDTASLHKDRPFYDQASGPRRRSLDQEDENLYENVQSRPRTPQNSRRQENYRVWQPRLQTLFDVLPYDHSPEVSPETRHSRTDTGNDTASLHKDRPFHDQARNVRGTNIREEINRSAFRQMKQNYEEEVCSLREYKNKLEESERAIHFLKEGQVDMQKEITRQNEAKIQLQNDYKLLQNKVINEQSELQDTKIRLQQCQKDLQGAQEENKQITYDKIHLENKITQLKQRASKEIDTLQNKLRDTEQLLRQTEKKLQDMELRLLLDQHEIQFLQEKNAQIQKSHESKWSKEMDALKAENDRLCAAKGRLMADYVRLEFQMAELRYDNTCSQLQTDNDQLKKQMKDYAALKNKLVTTEQELNTTKLELKETKDRSNTCLGDQETKDSPNIVELSDINRPSKLAERYKELYDNQWTDAYEILEESIGAEEQIISILLNILVETRRFCDNQTEIEMDHILRAITRKDSVLQSDVPVSVIKYIKSCRKSTVAETMKIKYKEYVDELRISPLSFVKHALHVDAYLLECFEVCWLMAIQDPPVVLAPVLKHGDAFWADLYSPYTVCGKIVDYVVWPALLLHTNGPTLTKGVVQGMKKR